MGTSGKRKKSSKNNTRTAKSFYFKFLLCVLVVEAYFIYNYAMLIVFKDGVKIQVDKFNMTSSIEPYYWYSINTQREMLYNKSRSIRGINSFKRAQDTPNAMYRLSNNLQDTHLKNTEYLEQDYLDLFNQIMIQDLCPDLISATGYFNNNIT